ncbi:MAG: hypothetical protein B7Z66_02190 [Chromatiales bacterium 21-64-14]|nr:MAG: hypothetical protein B7Z66_02190 [Chromatiales bacterium 21-64-14]HQU16494.1 hypothetical protein [Gammaproteobacteria bacterium]
MPGELEPRVGDWYRITGGGQFEVVAVDEDDGTVEIQHFDATVEEMDLDAWFEMDLEPIEPPEDWSGSLDIERDDYGVDLGPGPEDWANPLDELD